MKTILVIVSTVLMICVSMSIAPPQVAYAVASPDCGSRTPAANLTGCDFTGVNWGGGRLQWCRFHQCQFHQCHFRSCRFHQCQFHRYRLHWCHAPLLSVSRDYWYSSGTTNRLDYIWWQLCARCHPTHSYHSHHSYHSQKM